jgi:MFS transporter, PAT family, beta-lactamase induction signal transducer AmpG
MRLLSSLTFLVGSLGRAAIGERIEQIGYAPVFLLCAAIGIVAVVFVILEWIRVAWSEKRRRQGDVLAADAARAAQGDTA